MSKKASETTSRLLIDEPPLQVLPSLAVKVGLNEAIVLQQVHYWLRTFQSSGKEDHLRDGKWWVYNSYDDWQDNFPFWGIGVIRRAIGNLEKKGLLISSEFNADKGDRTKWYSIDYKALAKLSRKSITAKAPDPFVADNRPSVANDRPSDQSEQMLNKKQRLATEIDSSKGETEETPEPKPKTQYVKNMEHLEAVFAHRRGIPPPDWDEDNGAGLNKTWRMPLRRILKKCDGRMTAAEFVIRRVVQQMKDDNLTFSMPAQIELTAESFIADMNEPETGNVRDFTAERLNQERQTTA